MQSHDTSVTKELKHGTLIVDAIDADLLMLNWYSHQNQRNVYARRSVKRDGMYFTDLLHRSIMQRIVGAEPIIGMQIDHVNGNGLDNRRSNIRLATNKDNGKNRTRVGINNKSGFVGVHWDSGRGKWRARIGIRLEDGKKVQIDLGAFDNIDDAANARRNAEQKYHGDFAPNK